VPSTRPKPPDQLPTVFTDRSLARYGVPDGIRALGFIVVTSSDLYGGNADDLADDVWLRDSARNGWPALTWDYLREAGLRRVIEDEEARVFRFEREDAPTGRQGELLRSQSAPVRTEMQTARGMDRCL
jgi:hypothetical protein